jgi:hypothetical protein
MEVMNMKNMFYLITIGAMFVGSYLTNNIYTRECKVHDTKDNMVTVMDCTGNLWQFESSDRFNITDKVTLVMDNMGTEDNIYDDVIKDIIR